MAYSIGVDLGTTYTAAAVWRNGQVEIATLGTSVPTLSSVVLLRADGSVLVGEAAERRGVDEPNRIAREFKRRLGDPTPLILGGTPYGAEALMSHLLQAVLAIIVEREGEPPSNIVLTHPVNYGPYKMEMLQETARLAGINMSRLKLLPEPVAAAVSYANRQRVEVGEIFAVYDFGGGTFDAAVLRRTPQGFQVIGRPEGMERLGGIDVDAAIVAHVDESLGGRIADLDGSQPDVLAGMTNLRAECREAKEALSSDTDAVIRVSLPGIQSTVRITRSELEQMIRPRVLETIDSLRRTVASAGIPMERVTRILLVGGSSRIPLVAELVQQGTGRPVGLDAHPKFAIATGAAIIGGAALQPSPAPAAPGRTGTQDPAKTASSGQLPSGSVPVIQPQVVQRPPTPSGQIPAIPPQQQRPVTASGHAPPPQQQYQAGGPPPGFGAPPGSRVPQGPANYPQNYAPNPQPGRPASPPKSRKNLYIGLGVAAALIIAIIVVVASRGGDSQLATVTTTRPVKTSPVTRAPVTSPVTDAVTTPQTTPDTSAVTTPETVPVTAPVTAPPTAAPTAAPPAVVDAASIHAALLQPSDLIGSGWGPDTLISNDKSICGQNLTAQTVRDDTSVMAQNPNTADVVEVIDNIEAYASASDAKSAFDQTVSIIKGCPTFTGPVASGGTETQEFQVLENPLPICDQSANFRVDTTFSTDTTNVILSEISVFRCGNIISSILVQQLRPTDGLLPQSSIDVGNDALQKSFARVSKLPRVA